MQYRYHGCMTQISVRLPDEATTTIDELVDAGAYATRTAFVTDAINRRLRTIREEQISEMYRRAYAEPPADDAAVWAANASRRALADTDPYE
jgi:Arc/MetJ-type ribon-helix-helix transcriptional regulator